LGESLDIGIVGTGHNPVVSLGSIVQLDEVSAVLRQDDAAKLECIGEH
jgi:hypothetical protein